MQEYTLIRSRRKTIAIYIRPGGQVEVRAPLRAPAGEIEAFVRAKASWIAGKRRLVLERGEQRGRVKLDYGCRVPVLGVDWLIAPGRTGYDLPGKKVLIPEGLGQNELKEACIRVYRNIARDILPGKIERFAARMGVRPAGLGITSAQSRWGSCSGKGRLNFSWRLMMAPEEAVDYVIVHELAHLREMNHSARFWAEVATVLPDYSERRVALKEAGIKIRQESGFFS